MRRPSPLPPPSEAGPGRARTLDVPARAEPGAFPPAGADTTPVLPLVTPPSRRTDGVPVDAEDAAGAGLRDVWLASRARRRALRAEVRRFTVRQRRRRRVWIGVVVALLALVVGTVGVAYSPLFAVERIEVVGTSQLDAAAVTTALDGQLGTPLALVDDSAIKAALVTFPLVESYTVEARPPHDLVVRIVERVPVGMVSGAAGFTLVDAAGVALSTSAQAPAGQPVLEISGGVQSEAFRAAGRVVRALPESVRAQVTGVTASTPDDVTLTLGSTGTRVVWGSAEKSAEKAIVLELLMKQSPPDSTKEYDVTSPEAGVIH